MDDEIGAGDQGLMFGYATVETEEYMPMTYWNVKAISNRNHLPAMDIIKVAIKSNQDSTGIDVKVLISLQTDIGYAQIPTCAHGPHKRDDVQIPLRKRTLENDQPVAPYIILINIIKIIITTYSITSPFFKISQPFNISDKSLACLFFNS